MKNITDPSKTTICVVNYKTELLTKLCLRSIRKHSADKNYEVIVVDNDSGDQSLEYLRSLKWIKLFERPEQVKQGGSWAHGTGLDIGLENATGEYFLAMHSDTLVRKDGWLDFLLHKISADILAACAGTGKLDLKPDWQIFLKKMTDIKKWVRKLKGTKRNDFYIRAICAIYRTEILKREDLKFSMKVEKGVTCGKQLYYELVDRKYKTVPVDSSDMAQYIHHLAHATMVLNPEFTVRKRTEKKCRRILERILSSPETQAILNDSSLDE